MRTPPGWRRPWPGAWPPIPPPPPARRALIDLLRPAPGPHNLPAALTSFVGREAELSSSCTPSSAPAFSP